MAWKFFSPETVTPLHVQPDDSTTCIDTIVETEYTGCAWCGDGEGCCDMHMAQMLAQSAERAARRRGGRDDE